MNIVDVGLVAVVVAVAVVSLVRRVVQPPPKACHAAPSSAGDGVDAVVVVGPGLARALKKARARQAS